MNKVSQVNTKATPSKSTSTPIQTNLLQRKCACGGSPGVVGECAECDSKRLNMQRRATNQAKASATPSLVQDTLRTPGQPLNGSTRSFMEARFGHDFSRVRVHTDQKAAESAREINALAYTLGQEIVFGSGQYAPTTPKGQRLLAHELAHVVQQNGSDGFISHYRVSNPTDFAEQEAEQAAAAVMENRPVPRLAPITASVHREGAENESGSPGTPATGPVEGGLTPPQGGTEGATPMQTTPPATGGATCARPINWSHSGASDNGPDGIQINISWGSSTGSLADLGNCTVREVVNYDAIPNPPFLWNPPNPTILTVPAVDGAAVDTHSYPPGLRTGITNPRVAGTMVAHQVYQFRCSGPGCSGNWETFPGQSYTITRTVSEKLAFLNPWRYRITKTGVSNPFTYSREVEIPAP